MMRAQPKSIGQERLQHLPEFVRGRDFCAVRLRRDVVANILERLQRRRARHLVTSEIVRVENQGIDRFGAGVEAVPEVEMAGTTLRSAVSFTDATSNRGPDWAAGEPQARHKTNAARIIDL